MDDSESGRLGDASGCRLCDRANDYSFIDLP